MELNDKDKNKASFFKTTTAHISAMHSGDLNINRLRHPGATSTCIMTEHKPANYAKQPEEEDSQNEWVLPIFGTIID